jgi:hypothetical protein
MWTYGEILGGNNMAIKRFIDKLTGKARREEEERLRIAAEAAAKRDAARARRAAKKAEEPLKPQGKKKAKAVENPAKIAANKAGEPWVQVLSIEVNKDDPGMGAFELDWNDKFVANLIRAGYQGKTDQDIVDNWFQAVCRNVVLETYQQEQADPEKRAAGSNRRDLGNGRTEIS